MALLLALCLLSVAFGITSDFYAVGRQINVSISGKAPSVFKIRGFSYSNSRIAEGAPTDNDGSGWDSLQRPKICRQDFDLMRQLNVNALKVYAFNVLNNQQQLHQECLDLAWNNGSKPIFLVLSIWITTFPFPDQNQRQFMASNYAKMVASTRDHPAVMGYSIGSEISGDPNNNQAYWDDFQLIAKSIRNALGGRRKIITTGTYQTDNANPPIPVIGHVVNGEKYHVDVDVWGVDVYSPDPDQPLLRENIFKYTHKPIFFPEYGVHFQPPADPVERSRLLLKQVNDMERYSYSEHRNGNQGPNYDPNGPIYAGGMIFEWVDEYWKAGVDGDCGPNPASAQPYYGSNAIRLPTGCRCLPPQQRSLQCYLDVRVPRPILTSNYLPTAWPSYEPTELQ